MKTLTLDMFRGDWNTLAQELERGGEPIALVINDTLHGILLPANEAQRVVERYAARIEARREQSLAQDVAANGGELPTYLELLRNDPSLVPLVDGQPLEFETMMNSSFVDPQQSYQFRDPRTGKIYTFWASELQQAIERPFASVEFIPDRPRDVVEGKLKLR